MILFTHFYLSYFILLRTANFIQFTERLRIYNRITRLFDEFLQTLATPNPDLNGINSMFSLLTRGFMNLQISQANLHT